MKSVLMSGIVWNSVPNQQGDTCKTLQKYAHCKGFKDAGHASEKELEKRITQWLKDSQPPMCGEHNFSCNIQSEVESECSSSIIGRKISPKSREIFHPDEIYHPDFVDWASIQNSDLQGIPSSYGASPSNFLDHATATVSDLLRLPFDFRER